MGMFDYVKINSDLLPISEEEKTMLGDSPGWQTKSYEDQMCVIEIRDNREIVYHYEKYKWDIEQENIFKGNGVIVYQGIEIKPIMGEGEIHFYTSTEKEGWWFEFDAKYKDGKVLEIVGGKVSEVDFYK